MKIDFCVVLGDPEQTHPTYITALFVLHFQNVSIKLKYKPEKSNINVAFLFLPTVYFSSNRTMDSLDYEGQYQLIGQRIKSLRQARGWSQAALGANADLEKSAIQRIERGYNSTLKTLLKLAAALGVSLAVLLTFDESSD